MTAITTNSASDGKLVLSERETLKRYAEHLKNQSWCVDVSAWPIKALHADSDYNAAIEAFRYDFPSWASRHRINVDCESYGGFLGKLVERLIPLLPRVVGSALRPVPEKFFERNGAKFANTYVPFAPDLPEAFVMPEILEDYLSRVFMNEQDRKYVSQWMADIIQNPARRPMWAVVLTGDQGTGKSSIYRLVSAALGFHHTWGDNDYAPAFKQFSEVLADHLLVNFDDAKAGRNTYQDLKQAITRTSMPVELKGVQKSVNREVFSRILICSNSPRPLIIEEGDRRLYVAEPCRHKVNEKETAEFFVRFNKWLSAPTTPAVLYHWLKSIDLSDFIPGSTIKTETHTQMVGLSTPVLDGLLAEYTKDRPIFHNDNLLEYLAEHGIKNPAPDMLKMKMGALGYEHNPKKYRPVEGCKKQFILWQPIGKRSRSLTPEEVTNIRRVADPEF